MKNTFVRLTSDKPSCAGFDDEYLYISSQGIHETFDALKKAASVSKSAWGGYTVVALRTIKEITCYQKGTNFFFRYDKSTKLKKSGLEISDMESRLAFCKDLALASGLKTKTETIDPYSRVQANAIPIIMIALFTGVGSFCASDLVPPAAPDSRSRAISEAFKIVGPIPILIIGLSIMAFFAVRLIRNIKASDTKIVYSTN